MFVWIYVESPTLLFLLLYLLLLGNDACDPYDDPSLLSPCLAHDYIKGRGGVRGS